MKRPKLDIDAFHAQFHNHDHYRHHESGEHRLEWWEQPEPRKRGARVDFRNGGRAGYAPGGGIAQLQQKLGGAFSDLNRQVAAQAPQQQQQAPANYQAMERQATGQAPNDAYQRMMAQALNGRSYEDMFPTTPKVAAPTTAVTPTAPAAAPVETPSAPAFDYGSWMASLMGGDGSAFKRGGRTNNIVERALAVTRRK